MGVPKSYEIRFIEPGIVSYNESGVGVVLVSREALDRMAPSFRNCPVIFVPESHDDSDASTAFNFYDVAATPASGKVEGFPFWKDDGWMWANISIWDEKTQEAIEKGFNVSCAYDPIQEGEGGIWHAIPYDVEMLDGIYKHLAIVKSPRYEGSKILANSKGGANMALFGIGKKNAAPLIPPKKPDAPAPQPMPKEKPQMLNDDTEVDVNGTPVPLHELISKYMESKGAGVPAALGDEDEVELPDGSKVKVAELKAAYGGAEPDGVEPDADDALQNAEPPTDAPAEPVVDTSKQGSVRTNSAPAPRKVNSALRNAAAKAGDSAGDDHPETRTERLSRGASRYSKAVPQGGK